MDRGALGNMRMGAVKGRRTARAWKDGGDTGEHRESDIKAHWILFPLSHLGLK